jgi:hypothetical protein
MSLKKNFRLVNHFVDFYLHTFNVITEKTDGQEQEPFKPQQP